MQAKEPRTPAHPEPPRQHFTSPWTLLGIAVVVGVTLVSIFPGRGLLTPTPIEQHDGPVGLTHLSNLARNEPDNAELNFTLAEKQREIGNFAEARAALKRLYNSPDPAVRQRARLSELKLQMQQMQTLDARSAERELESARLRHELIAMAQYDWDVAGLRELSDIANQLGARKLSAELYYRIVRDDQEASRQWIDETAQKVLADGEYRTAADIYFIAQVRASSLEQKRYDLTQAMKAYQAGNMVREALQAADAHLGPLANDDQTLQFMIELARMANDMLRAQTYAKRLMRISSGSSSGYCIDALACLTIRSAMARATGDTTRLPPHRMRRYEPYIYHLAYEVFSASRTLQDAYRVSRSAVDQVPNDMRWRERLARVSERSGKSGEALEQWLFIARRTGNANAWRAVLRLTPSLTEDEGLIDVLRNEARTRALSQRQWRALVAAYERLGRLCEAIGELENEYARRRRMAIIATLVYLREASGENEGGGCDISAPERAHPIRLEQIRVGRTEVQQAKRRAAGAAALHVMQSNWRP
ncbi:MAG TPA: hypothetical protein VFB75_11180 [Burkholderiales bacterium]|nr:hypothetical protein [Burkholderiales bacterium]